MLRLFLMLTKNECKLFFEKFDSLSWSSFDNYRQHTSSMRFVLIDEKNWKHSKCSCGWWAKNYKCKHVIAISERLGKCDYPLNALVIPVGQKRKRGQPKKTASALKRQTEEVLSSDSDSSDSDTLTADTVTAETSPVPSSGTYTIQKRGDIAFTIQRASPHRINPSDLLNPAPKKRGRPPKSSKN